MLASHFVGLLAGKIIRRKKCLQDSREVRRSPGRHADDIAEFRSDAIAAPVRMAVPHGIDNQHHAGKLQFDEDVIARGKWPGQQDSDPATRAVGQQGIFKPEAFAFATGHEYDPFAGQAGFFPPLLGLPQAKVAWGQWIILGKLRHEAQADGSARQSRLRSRTDTCRWYPMVRQVFPVSALRTK
jgi:hypothetical protein